MTREIIGLAIASPFFIAAFAKIGELFNVAMNSPLAPLAGALSKIAGF